METFLVWDWARICPTNTPSCIGTNEAWLRVSKGAECAGKGEFSSQACQHFNSRKEFSQCVVLYQRATWSWLPTLNGKCKGHAEQTGSGLISILNWQQWQLLEDRVNVWYSCLVEEAWHFQGEIHCNLEDRSDNFSSKPEEGSFILFPLTVGGNLCPGFGSAGGSFVRPAAPRILKSLGILHECPGTTSQYRKTFLATYKGLCSNSSAYGSLTN